MIPMFVSADVYFRMFFVVVDRIIQWSEWEKECITICIYRKKKKANKTTNTKILGQILGIKKLIIKSTEAELI